MLLDKGKGRRGEEETEEKELLQHDWYKLVRLGATFFFPLWRNRIPETEETFASLAGGMWRGAESFTIQ